MKDKKIKVVAVAGELTGWKVTIALHEVLEAMKKIEPNLTTELIEMKEYDVEFVTGQPLSYYNDDTWEVVSKIASSDIVIFGTPIYQASITGALKNLFDHFPVDAFNRKVTGMVTVGGVEKHFLVSEYQLRPILSYLKGLVPRRNVFVHSDSFSEINEIVDENVLPRIKLMAEEMLQLYKCV